MPQQLSTTLQLDALLSSGFKETFTSASDLMADLKKESTELKKQLNQIGREADEIEKVGKSADDLRKDMQLLERQIKETAQATEKFGEARSHFRSASIGARALKSELAGIVDTAKNATLAIAGIGVGAAVALSPGEELLEFDQIISGTAAISPEIDASGIEEAKAQIRELSNDYGTSTAEIAMMHQQLTRAMGFDAAQETITAAVEFQTATGLSITEIEDELATARISLGVDTPAETQEFLQLLQGAHAQGIKIDNIDLGDLETLRKRTGEDVSGENFQREFLTTIAFRQVDSFQFADYAQAFQEEIGRATLISPEMDAKAIEKAQTSIATLEKWGIRAEDGILGAMQVYQELSDAQRVEFFTELEPVLTAMPAEVIARGSEVLPEITAQVNAIMESDRTLKDAAKETRNTWSATWEDIGNISQNTLGILQEDFATAFGPPILGTVKRFSGFISSHRDEIQNFFTGIRDGASPVIEKVWNTAREAYPTLRTFAKDVWTELRAQWDAIAPAARVVWNVISGIGRAAATFLTEHPRLVATLITGVAVWKAYSLASQGVQVVGDVVRGTMSMASGHIHRLNAMILENTRLQGTLQTASGSASRYISGIGRAAFAAIPGIGAMGGSLMAAVMPALPVILPVVAGAAALGAAGYLVYRNWEPIKQFFTDNFQTIRDVLMVVFPPLGLLVGFAGVIRDNWEGIKEFFSTTWETIRLGSQVAFEFIQFIGLSALSFLKNAWAEITGFFSDVWGSVREMFMNTPLAPVFEWMVNGIKAVVSPLTDFFSNLWDGISQKAGEMLDWVTGKVEWFNNVLQNWLGWLKGRNDELRAELAGNVSIDAPADVPTAEIPTPEALPAVEIEKAPHPENPEVDTLKVPAQNLELTPPGEFIKENIGDQQLTQKETVLEKAVVPETQTASDVVQSEVSAPAQQVLPQSKDFTDIGLGILSETRKQTLLLEKLSDVGGETSVIEVAPVPALPKMPEIPSQESISSSPAIEIAQSTIETPTIETPTVDIAEPTIEKPMMDVQTPQIAEMPELVFNEYQMPALPVVSSQSDPADTPSGENSATRTPVTVNLTMNIQQLPGQDPEALAAIVAEMVMQKIDESTETYLVE